MNTFLNGFQSVLAAASVDNFSGIFLIGDTNAKHKDWCDKDESCLRGRILQSFMLSNGLNQIITEHTRFGKNHHVLIIFSPILHGHRAGALG